jgi:hypothetical protein
MLNEKLRLRLDMGKTDSRWPVNERFSERVQIRK